MSILAHIVLGGKLPGEPAATQALDYISNSSSDVAQAFVNVLGKAGIYFEPGRIESEVAHGKTQPDLTIRDTDGQLRVFVENKFWAGLTKAQPVSYLRNLPRDIPSALLFIVPEQRIAIIWSELKERCSQKSLYLTDESPTSGVIWARAGPRVLLITSWRYVLDVLRDAARECGRGTIERDVLQLRGLTDRMDSEAFLPLCADEITDQGLARRPINYSDLIEDITQELVQRRIADTEGLRATHGYYSAGPYLRVYKRFGLWLGVELERWRDLGITPLWWCPGHGDFSGTRGEWSKFKQLFNDAQDYEGSLCIPIRLTTGVERDRVISNAVSQMQRIADALLEAFPGE